MQEYILGEKSAEDLKELGIEITDDNKTKFSNAVQKLYEEDEITREQAVQKLGETGLYHAQMKSQSDAAYCEGKVEKWDIQAYKDAYVDSLSNGNETQKSRDIIREIAKLPHTNAFPSGTKSSYEKLLTYIRKWKKGN